MIIKVIWVLQKDNQSYPSKFVFSMFLVKLIYTTLWTKSVDDTLISFFSYFNQKIGSVISCKVSP